MTTNVQMVRHTTDPEDLLMLGYGKCYQKDTVLNTIVRHLKHMSVLEHVNFTFDITISRACLAQLSRHRTAKFTVESQRYVSYKDGFNIYTPIEIRRAILGADEFKGTKTEVIWKNAHDCALNHYNMLLGLGFKKQDARYVLPNSAMCNLLMTIDLRNIINLFHLRLDGHAQEEIRVLAWRMLVQSFSTMPNLRPSLIKLIEDEIGEKDLEEAIDLAEEDERLVWKLVS